MEPATPLGGSALHRDNPTCTSISSSNPHPLAVSYGSVMDPGANPAGDTDPWGAWPKVGAQWAVQQETIQVGQALADCSIPVSSKQQQQLILQSAVSNPSKSDMQGALVCAFVSPLSVGSLIQAGLSTPDRLKLPTNFETCLYLLITVLLLPKLGLPSAARLELLQRR